MAADAGPAAGGLILGSASPRRAALLGSLDLPFTVRAVSVDETSLAEAGPAEAADPASLVERIALAKFTACSLEFDGDTGADGRTILLTADTMVACVDPASGKERVLGKPTDRAALSDMLVMMSGRELCVVTAVCAGPPGAPPRGETVTTRVWLRPIARAEIDAYVASGAGDDKAGGLALQSEAAPFIASVEGCWSNVVGLPICAVTRLLREEGEEETVCDEETVCSVGLCGGHGG